MRARAAIISLREKLVDETEINDRIQAAMDARDAASLTC
jgi:hypothetical protein